MFYYVVIFCSSFENMGSNVSHAVWRGDLTCYNFMVLLNVASKNYFPNLIPSKVCVTLILMKSSVWSTKFRNGKSDYGKKGIKPPFKKCPYVMFFNRSHKKKNDYRFVNLKTILFMGEEKGGGVNILCHMADKGV